MVLNFLAYNFICTCMNEKSRALTAELHTILPHNPNIFIWVETFHRKISDVSWGLTLGKFFLMERTAFVGLISAMITFLALYGQFAQTAIPPTNATSVDTEQLMEHWRN
uniref:Uncharacterized protein n=1 Tax=Plectus sambesii TaxID=2011161 RepID=A0A914VJA1_9BILA